MDNERDRDPDSECDRVPIEIPERNVGSRERIVTAIEIPRSPGRDFLLARKFQTELYNYEVNNFAIS